MAKAKETGINRFNFNIIRIFILDFPGQSTEVDSTFSGRTIGIYRDFDHTV
jgi:hypothetical protein